MKLAEYRRRHGLTLAKMAALLDVSESTVSRYENGRVPDARVMARIIKVCGGEVRPDEFYGLDDDPKPETEAA